ncbi:MAG: hypothetical protein CMO55_22465 [Verrucomicrobiales bacterium]|nr:hypothetical protein [Verrucomicrobiales bacterium]
MSTTSLPVLPAFQLLGQPVEISRIEKELQNLFLDGSDEGADQVGVARASLINLALYDEDQENLEYDASVLAEITSESACRSLLISAAPHADATGAKAWVQVHCQIDKNGRKTVCTEQISFYLAGNTPGLVRNIVFAHLDSDLPLAFWWRGEFSDAFEHMLYSRIDRLIFDSEAWDMPRNQFLRLLDAQEESSSTFVMHDFAFTRLNSVRHAIANAFDRPAVANYLTSLKKVSIRYADGFDMSANYLAAWLAHRLEASLDRSQSSAGKMKLFSHKRGMPSEVMVEIEPLSEDRKGFVEVDFQLGDVRIEISRCQTREFLRTLTHLASGVVEEDWLPAKKMTDATLVGDILNRAGHNRTHSMVMPIVQEILTL